MTERTTEPAYMDINAVLKQLPHRYPFLLVDRVLECTPGKTIRAIKNAANAVVGSNRSVAKLAPCRGLPPVARTVVCIVLLEASSSGIVLTVVASHLVNHNVERGNKHDPEVGRLVSCP